MKKSIIIILFIMSILLANAAENGSIGDNNLKNASDLPVMEYAEAGLNEIQTGSISNAESVEDAAEIFRTNAINSTTESGINSNDSSITGENQQQQASGFI